MQPAPGRSGSNERGAERPLRLCVIVSQPGPEAAALRTAIASVATYVELADPAAVGAQLWRAPGPRVLVACGTECAAVTEAWLALFNSSTGTATIVLLDASRAEIIAALQQFDVWLPLRTAPDVVAQQVAALFALIERQSRLSSPRRIQAHNMVIDLGREEVLDADDERIPLTPSEFRLLAAMAVQPGRVVDFWQLGAALPGQFRDAEDAYNSVKVHIGRLRQKLARATGWDGHLVSVRGRGFLFERRAPRQEGPAAGSEPAASLRSAAVTENDAERLS